MSYERKRIVLLSHTRTRQLSIPVDDQCYKTALMSPVLHNVRPDFNDQFETLELTNQSSCSSHQSFINDISEDLTLQRWRLYQRIIL